MTIVPDVNGFQSGLQAGGRKSMRQRSYLFFKRAFDLGFTTILLLPATLIVGLALLILNPIYNPGPLLFPQVRMGRDCRPFWAFKFLTMRQPVEGEARCRAIHEPVETDRITRLGLILRRTRFDELPQIFNVYRGDMSLIGPRPDYFVHAHRYIRQIPEYRDRHAGRPGISGLAQIELGYAQGVDDTRRKTAADIEYIRRAGFGLDTWIFWQTILTVVGMRGE